MRASSSVMTICSFSVAPIPPYWVGQWGAIQPLRESVRYHGINSAGGGRTVRPRSTAGRLASSQLRTCMRNSASAGVSRRNMAMRLNADGEGDQSDVGGFDDGCPLGKLVGEQFAEFG